MTSEQYRALLEELARVGGLADPAPLLSEGRVTVGESSAVLAHDPGYDPDLLQVRILLGEFPAEHAETIMRGALETNYLNGYGGECVFSLYPRLNHLVATVRVRLRHGMSGQELWQDLSDMVRMAVQVWEESIALVLRSEAQARDAFAAAATHRA
jgi:hypothetical protein